MSDMNLGVSERLKPIHAEVVRMVTEEIAPLDAEYLAEVAAAMPEKRLTSAMDVADVAQFLFTPAADSMYGTVIPVSRADRR